MQGRKGGEGHRLKDLGEEKREVMPEA